MNDPHVVALIYRLKHAESVNYDKAPALEHETDTFVVRISQREARFEMKEHFASDESARQAVQPFIRAWELSASLERGSAEFELVFQSAEIEDRKPQPGAVLNASSGTVVTAGQTVSLVVSRTRFPDPPVGFTVNADVEAMLARYA